jgi:cytochrome c peroxidase
MGMKLKSALFLAMGCFCTVWGLGLVDQGNFCSLQVRIEPRFNSRPLVFDALALTNAAGQSLSVTRLDFLLSDIALRRSDGTWLNQSNRQAFISLREKRASFHLGNLPAGNYDRIRFHVGLPPALNHANPASYDAGHPLNPNLDGLHWGWSGGYVFFAIEGHWRTEGGTMSGYSFHLANDAMLMNVELPLALQLSNNQTLGLALNTEKLFTKALTADNSTTHSRAGDELAPGLRASLEGAFLATAAVGKISDDGGLHPAGVKVARAVAASAKPYHFTISAQFPIPDLPRDNPLTEEGVELGHRLFGEKLLSINNSQSCASCHRAEAAFADPGKSLNLGAEGIAGTRNAMPIFNLAWKKSFFWDGSAASLREQVLMPIENPVEMHETLTNAAAKLARTEVYPELFRRAFGTRQITGELMARALEQFVLAQVSFNSKFDHALDGKEALTEEEKRGFELFMTEYDPRHGQLGADCFHCHGGPFFTTHGFANNGLDSAFKDVGRFAVTKNEADDGKFSVPSLRNVELTGPYMHDGRFKTLEEVVEQYSAGMKRSATLDPNLAKHPDGGVPLTAADKKSLVAFLKTLTDESLKKPEKCDLTAK